MTIHDKIKGMLFERGIFENDCETILAQAKVAAGNEGLKRVWNADTSEYPSGITALALMAAKRQTIKWMDANYPEHWARSLFV